MYYICHWVDVRGVEKEEGIFKVVKETKIFTTIEMIKEGKYCKYPKIKTRKLPKEFIGFKPTKFLQRAYFWANYIQIYHGLYEIPFIYKPYKKMKTPNNEAEMINWHGMLCVKISDVKGLSDWLIGQTMPVVEDREGEDKFDWCYYEDYLRFKMQQK